MLSSKRGIRWGLYLDVDDDELRGDGLGEVLVLEDRRSLRCFFVVRDILWKSCVVDGDTLGGAATSFGVATLRSLKIVYCCGFKAEYSLEKME